MCVFNLRSVVTCMSHQGPDMKLREKNTLLEATVESTAGDEDGRLLPFMRSSKTIGIIWQLCTALSKQAFFLSVLTATVLI